MKRWILPIEHDPETGDAILNFPEDLLEETSWKEGDVLEWINRGDGSWQLKKKVETELILVECVNQFRTRYLVEVPKGKQEWALDTVTLDQAKEFSQDHLTEIIVSSRVISEEEAIVLGKQDNPHLFKSTTPNSSDKDILTKFLITREGV